MSIGIVKGIWSSWFDAPPSVEELRLKLKELEREQTKVRREGQLVSDDKATKLQEAVAAEKAGKEELLQDVFREMRQLDIDASFFNRELRRMSLGKMALKGYIRRLEMLDRRKDQKSIESLIGRIRSSSLQTLIAKAEVSDDMFMATLEDILGEEEAAAAGPASVADAGYEQFKRTVSAIARAEDGNADAAEIERLKAQAEQSLKVERSRDE